MEIERTLLHRLKAAPEYLWLLLLVNDITRHTGRFEVAARSWRPVSRQKCRRQGVRMGASPSGWRRDDMDKDNSPITLAAARLCRKALRKHKDGDWNLQVLQCIERRQRQAAPTRQARLLSTAPCGSTRMEIGTSKCYRYDQTGLIGRLGVGIFS